MTRDEMKKIIMVIASSYPNWKPMDLSMTVDVWHSMLSDYSYNDIAMALKAYITADTSGFAPSIGQLVDKTQTINSPAELDEMEAWSLVSKAIRNGNYGYVEEFAKLPPLVQKAIGIPEQLRIWAIDEHYNEMVVSSNFMRSYQTVLARSRENTKMPEDISRLIESAYENSWGAEIEKKRELAIGTMMERRGREVMALEEKKEYAQAPAGYKEKLKKEWEDGTQ